MRLSVAFVVLVLFATSTYAQDFEKAIKPVLVAHCFSCHGPGMQKAKGDLRLDRLSLNFADGASRDMWQEVAKRVRAGDMPPETKPRPTEKELAPLLAWIDAGVKSANERRAVEGRTVLRRLNRIEYENTLRDLLGVSVDVREMLPMDGSAGGFDNVGEALHTSSFLMEKYLEAADKALNVAISNLPQPPLIQRRYFLKETHLVKNTTEKVYRHEGDTVVAFSSSPWQAIGLSPFYPPDRGKYRFRISASGYQSQGKPVTYRVDAGTMSMTGRTQLVGFFDAQADKPTLLEFTEYLEPRSTIRLLPYGLGVAHHISKIGADKYDGPGLAVHWIEAEGPLHDSWPPESHRRIFGVLPQIAAPIYNSSKRVEVASKDPEADATKILLKFARRAFRRTVTDADIQPYLKLTLARLADKHSFEQAVRVGLIGILVSPDFLFLKEKPGLLDDFALASRLSYFLWSTMPDDELLQLAEQKSLSDPATMRRQVERLLSDPKSKSFTENFVSQWLNLRDIDATIPSHILYPEYDEMLKHSMLRETYLFFEEVLKNDLSLANFIASDFAMLNGRLAKHYGIEGVEGWEFKKVKLPPDSHRGGVLTMASTLKVTANGTYTSPILRGAWVLERILGTPPPRPPDGVVAIEPDIRGATTVREQMAKHRSVATCAGCHKSIDPPGFALESFDVIGGWREFYRTSGNGKPVFVGERRMPYLRGKNVDPSDVLPDGRKFQNIDEFKQLLLKDKDQVAKNLTERLATYATGAAPHPADEPEVKAIVERIRGKEYGLKTLVQEVVASRLFRNK